MGLLHHRYVTGRIDLRPWNVVETTLRCTTAQHKGKLQLHFHWPQRARVAGETATMAETRLAFALLAPVIHCNQMRCIFRWMDPLPYWQTESPFVCLKHPITMAVGYYIPVNVGTITMPYTRTGLHTMDIRIQNLLAYNTRSNKTGAARKIEPFWVNGSLGTSARKKLCIGSRHPFYLFVTSFVAVTLLVPGSLFLFAIRRDVGPSDSFNTLQAKEMTSIISKYTPFVVGKRARKLATTLFLTFNERWPNLRVEWPRIKRPMIGLLMRTMRTSGLHLSTRSRLLNVSRAFDERAAAQTEIELCNLSSEHFLDFLWISFFFFEMHKFDECTESRGNEINRLLVCFGSLQTFKAITFRRRTYLETVQ